MAAKSWHVIQLVGEAAGEAPDARADVVAVPMSGGMLLWSGYGEEGGHRDDTWQFANPAGTAMEQTTTTIETLTQTIQISQTVQTVEKRDPTWNEFASSDAVSATEGSGAVQSGLMRPAARRGAAAVPLVMMQGFAIFGGKSQEGLLDDLWILECGLIDNTWMWFVVLGCVVALGLLEVLRRWCVRYRRRRKTLNRVTELLKSLGAKVRACFAQRAHLTHGPVRPR